MTIIVAAVDHAGVIHAGCDTNTMQGEDLLVGMSPDKLGLVETKPNDGHGDITGPEQALFGSAGRAAISQLVREGRVSIPTPPTLDIADLDRWAYDVAERLTDAALKHDMRDADDSDAADFAGVLGFHGQLWLLAHYETTRFTPDPMVATTGNDGDESFHPVVRPGWVAVGSGRSFSMGVMHALYDHVDADEAVDRALHAAVYDSRCGGPYRRYHLPPVRAWTNV